MTLDNRKEKDNGGKFSAAGEVRELLPNARFRVLLENGREILAHASGKIRMRRIRIVTGDRVTVEVSGYDFKRGRIVYRDK
ncbi:MAG: translation initiation factor IF-1 [Gammaproteobacteria bacterium]